MEKNSEAGGTFPDLICTFGDDGSFMTSASVEEGDRVYLTTTDKDLIPIGDGNRYPEVYEPIERALWKPMVSHLKGFSKNDLFHFYRRF